MTQTYTIKPLTWKEWNIKRYNPDGSAQIEVHYTASSILNYDIAPLSDEVYCVTVLSETSTGGKDFWGSECVESVDAAKEWCNKHLFDYLSEALEPAAVKGEGQ